MTSRSKTSDKWEITANRYVAFIDIMGFKDLVARSSHEEIYELMKKIDQSKKFNENIKWNNSDETYVRSTFYSDSIIIYSKDDSYDSAYSINCTVSAITSDLLSTAIPHKGAISFGKMTLDENNSIFFGQPLIDAYLLQEELTLYCIVVHSSAELEFENRGFIDNKKLILKNYLCNFKGGSSNHLVIPPLYARENKNYKEQHEALNNGVKKLRLRTSGHLRKYIDYTDAYLKYIKDHPNIY